MHTSIKRYAFGGLVVAALAGAVIWGSRTPAVAEPPAAPQAAEVDVAEVVSRDVIDWRSYSGRLEAVERVEIRPLVSGTLTRIHFRDGSVVAKGDLLFTIDPRPYEAEVARRAAAIGREVDELRVNGLAGSPDEVVDKIGRFAEIGTERIYLQVLDLSDLDHLELIADRVAAQLA